MAQLINVDKKSHALSINPTGLSLFEAEGPQPCSIVVSCGGAGLGKSALMNRLCGDGPDGPFATSAEPAACTQGMQVALDAKQQWWCDVEGERGAASDALPVKLAVLAGVIGKVFLYHHRGRIQKEELLPVLSTLGTAAARVAESKTPFGHLIVVLRDTPGHSASHQAVFQTLIRPNEDIQGPQCATAQRFEAARCNIVSAFQSVELCSLPYPFVEDGVTFTDSFDIAVGNLREKITMRMVPDTLLDSLDRKVLRAALSQALDRFHGEVALIQARQPEAEAVHQVALDRLSADTEERFATAAAAAAHSRHMADFQVQLRNLMASAGAAAAQSNKQQLQAAEELARVESERRQEAAATAARIANLSSQIQQLHQDIHNQDDHSRCVIS